MTSSCSPLTLETLTTVPSPDPSPDPMTIPSPVPKTIPSPVLMTCEKCGICVGIIGKPPVPKVTCIACYDGTNPPSDPMDDPFYDPSNHNASIFASLARIPKKYRLTPPPSKTVSMESKEDIKVPNLSNILDPDFVKEMYGPE